MSKTSYHKWHSLLAVLIGLAVLGAVMSVTWQSKQGSAVIQTEQNGATLHFWAEPSVVMWRGDCTTVYWEVEGVSAVYIEDVGTIGFGEQVVCVRPRYMPRLTYSVPDSANRYVLDLPVSMLTEEPPVQAAFWFMVGSLFAAVFLWPSVRRRWDALTVADRWHWVALLGIVALGYAFRVAYIERAVMLDETLTLYDYARQPTWYDVISNYREPNNHIFHTMMVRFVDAWLGHAPWIFRLPAFVFGVLVVPMSYWLGRGFYDKYIGLMTAALVASTYRLVDYSSDARGYTLLLAIVLGIYIAANRLRQPNAPRYLWALYAVLAALGFFTLPTMYYPMGAVSLWLLVSLIVEYDGRERRDKLIAFSGAIVSGALLTLALYTPVIVRNGNDLFNGFMAQPVTMSRLELLGTLAPRLWGYLHSYLPPILVLILWAGIVTAHIFHRRTATYRVPLLVTGLVWALLVFTVQKYDVLERLWLWVLPLMMMLAAVGLRHLLDAFWSESRASWGGVAIAAVFGVLAAWGIVAQDGMTITNGGRAIVGAEDVVLYLLDEDLNQHNITGADAIITQQPADWPLRFYLEYYRFDEQPNLTHYLYDTELEQMQAGEIRRFAYAPVWLWDSAGEIVDMRGVNVERDAVEIELVLDTPPWKFYEIHPVSGE